MPDQTYYYMSNINSFPTTKRESVNKLLTENSLTRLINRLLDVDSFIISDGLATALNGSVSEAIGNGGKHLEINNNLRLDEINFKDDLFEFVIRGYYFSTNINELLLRTSWDSYIESHGAVDKIGLFARIFIDNTNSNYPELVGQNSFESNDPETTLDDDYLGVQFFICPINENGEAEKPKPEHPVLPTTTDAITQEQVIEDLGNSYTYYDLLLIEYIRNNDTYRDGSYLPFDSLTKFDSHSVRIIDGGLF